MSSSMRATLLGSYPMKGGDGPYSYTKNSDYQRIGSISVKKMIDEAIIEKLDVKSLTCSTSNTFRLADFGCSVGPNTIIAMQNLMETIKLKYQSQLELALAGLDFPSLDSQVFFNDHASNDFNTLFSTHLPPGKPYFAAGVPGSFHGRLFPESSLHFAHASYSLHWLSKAPEGCLDVNSDAYNKGRIFHVGAPEAVRNAYVDQFGRDIDVFLDGRAKELVIGGMMVLIMASFPDGIPYSCLSSAIMCQLMESCLLDMAKEGIISESGVDSFNLPMYSARPSEMATAIERNGCFSIERMELSTSPAAKLERPINWGKCTMNCRAAMEEVYAKHFGTQNMDELFARLVKKTEEFSQQLESGYMDKTQLFIILMRK